MSWKKGALCPNQPRSLDMLRHDGGRASFRLFLAATQFSVLSSSPIASAMAFSGYAVQGQMPGYAAHPAPRAAQPVIHPAAGYPAYSTYPIQVRSGAVGNSAYQYPQQPHPQLPQQFSARRSTAAPASQIRSPNAGSLNAWPASKNWTTSNGTNHPRICLVGVPGQASSGGFCHAWPVAAGSRGRWKLSGHTSTQLMESTA